MIFIDESVDLGSEYIYEMKLRNGDEIHLVPKEKIVRCENCKWWKQDADCRGMLHNGFCSDGVEK